MTKRVASNQTTTSISARKIREKTITIIRDITHRVILFSDITSPMALQPVSYWLV
jgi:hypothetical protein